MVKRLGGIAVCIATIHLGGLALGQSRAAEIRPEILGPSVVVDPGFAYYRDRSPESIAAELKYNGYKAVRYIVTVDSAINSALIDAFHRAGLAVWYTTFGNGVYSTKGLPEAWEDWRMVTRQRKPAAGFAYLCFNDPGYRKWKREQVVSVVRNYKFDGYETGESFFPAWGGPTSDLYGCLCDDCKREFLRKNPGLHSIPEFEDENSPRYYRNDRQLYAKWVQFRVGAVNGFLDYIVNGKGGVRDAAPDIAVCTWSVCGDTDDPVEAIREWEGIDAALMVARIKPDVHCFQTDWPDWMRPKLKPDYVLKYSPFVESVRQVAPKLPLVLLADIGSQENTRRSLDWLESCRAACKSLGIVDAPAYEYHIGGYMYTDRPRVLHVEAGKASITLVFSKRVDAATASDIANYSLEGATILSATVDGSLVTLNVNRLTSGREYVLRLRNIEDTPDRWFFKGYPTNRVADDTSVRLVAR